MKYPPSERIGTAHDPEGRSYSMEFYGENEGAAVINGPVPMNTGRLDPVPEVHREGAAAADEARDRLHAWVDAHGWRR